MRCGAIRVLTGVLEQGPALHRQSGIAAIAAFLTIPGQRRTTSLRSALRRAREKRYTF
jgi:hypothetical protein